MGHSLFSTSGGGEFAKLFEKKVAPREIQYKIISTSPPS